MKTKTGVLITAGLAIFWAGACTGRSDSGPNQFQGFGQDVGDWSPMITRVHDGNGILRIPPNSQFSQPVFSASGQWHAEIANYGNVTYFDNSGDAAKYPGSGIDQTYDGDFYQSIDVYIDATLNPQQFSIVMAPSNTKNSSCSASGDGAAHGFLLAPSSDKVNVRIDAPSATPVATLDSGSWYTFVVTFRKADKKDNGSTVLSDMMIFKGKDYQHNLLSSVQPKSAVGLTAGCLGGHGYISFPYWTPSGSNILAIDNVRTGHLKADGTLEGNWNNNGD